MAITLSEAYLAELKKAVNEPNVIIEVALDSGTVKWGYSKGGFTDVAPILKSVSSLQNKLDTKAGYATRGALTVVITGRDNFKNLVRDEYLKNRRVVRKDGFTAPGFAYSDYASTYTGKVVDWSRKADELTITVSDDLIDASKKIPVENSTKTQCLDYRNSNPVDIMTDILSNRLGIGASYIDSAKFTAERDTWLYNCVFDRVLTEPKEANEYLNELQIETNSFVIHDGQKISYKVFGPATPDQTIEEWADKYHILENTLTQKSGYKDNFFNRVVVYYDYDESGNDREENYEAAAISVDAASQDSSQWSEVKTKVIKSKWIRTRTYAHTANITGVRVYHISRANGAGNGTLDYNRINNTLQWTAPGGSPGEAVKLSRDGKFQVYDADKTKYARVLVTAASLPGADKTDTVTITALGGETFAASLATKLLNRYRDPVSTVSFEIDINNGVSNGEFIKPTDLKDLTTDEAFEKGEAAWALERIMITSVRPDFTAHKVAIEAVETRLYRRYGFIAPAGLPDYGSATPAQRQFAYIGDADNKLNGGTEDGYYIID